MEFIYNRIEAYEVLAATLRRMSSKEKIIRTAEHASIACYECLGWIPPHLGNLDVIHALLFSLRAYIPSHYQIPPGEYIPNFGPDLYKDQQEALILRFLGPNRGVEIRKPQKINVSTRIEGEVRAKIMQIAKDKKISFSQAMEQVVATGVKSF